MSGVDLEKEHQMFKFHVSREVNCVFNNKTLTEWLEERAEVGKMILLTELCANFIRKNILRNCPRGNTVIDRIEDLPVPRALRNYLSLEGIFQFCWDDET